MSAFFYEKCVNGLIDLSLKRLHLIIVANLDNMANSILTVFCDFCYNINLRLNHPSSSSVVLFDESVNSSSSSVEFNSKKLKNEPP